MRKLKVSKIWILAFLLAVAVVGCNDPDKNSSASNPGAPLTPPTVIFVTPKDGNVGVCPNANPVRITAVFSKAMNPATINSPATTFTLTGPGGTSVAGAVTYVASTNTATFTPTAALSASTTFTATITTGATDMFGNRLAANFVWTFTTSAVCVPVPPPGQGSACGFGILAGSTVTNTGPSNVTGDVGVWAGTAITGFPPGTLTGTQHSADAVAQQAQSDLTVAYNIAAGAPGGAALPGGIGGPGTAPFPPGVYKATSTLLITGDITLAGNANDVWIFQVGSALTTAAGTTGGVPNSRVLLSGGALAKNVTWQIGSSATLGTFSLFQGSILAQSSITLGTSATLNGRALARIGAVTLDSNNVNVPPCP